MAAMNRGPEKPRPHSARGPEKRKKKYKGPDQKLSVPKEPEASALPVDLEDKCLMTLNGLEYMVRADELDFIREVGRGGYGVVSIYRHPPSMVEMAVKRIHVSVTPEERKRLKNEVATCMESRDCPYMVTFHGAMFREGDVWICMEVMDASLDRFIKICTDMEVEIPENVLGKIAFSIIAALDFMKETLKMTHRDVKPSNILANRQGEIKLCDFGIAGQVTLSFAKTLQAGCKPYMAPERVNPPPELKAHGVDVRSDVWSLGITMIELATLQHPFSRWSTPFEQLRQVVQTPSPKLPEGRFSDSFVKFINDCLKKDFKERPRFRQLLEFDFITQHKDLPAGEISPFMTSVLNTQKQQQDVIDEMMSKLWTGGGGDSNMILKTQVGPPPASPVVMLPGAGAPVFPKPNGVTKEPPSSADSSNSSEPVLR